MKNRSDKMKQLEMAIVFSLLVGLGSAWGLPAAAVVDVQCPGDLNGDADWDDIVGGVPEVRPPGVRCMHLVGGDGFVNMADTTENPTLTPLGDTRGLDQYIFGYGDATGMAPQNVLNATQLRTVLPGPTIELEEGEEFFLSLTNIGMVMRPDLDDAHTVHWHGYPNSSPATDGVPDVGISIHMGGTLTYYYNVVEPGTYVYHCHVEALEHMEMGMYAHLWVNPAQNGTAFTDAGNGSTYTRFVYNDGDGTTGYDVAYPIMLSTLDVAFHEADRNVQPLPFTSLGVDYPMINGRGYPETTIEAPLANSFEGNPSQPMSSRIVATQGERVLLRLSNLSITRGFTFSSPSLSMKVVGMGARILRGGDSNGNVYDVDPLGQDLMYETNSVTLAGGQVVEVLLDTAQIPVGTYFLYTTNLNFLSNDGEDRGGMMTEMIVNAP